jgi:rhodanese-related sulfurtransferase
MKTLTLILLFITLSVTAAADDQDLERYVSNFDYAARKEMKVDSKGLIEMLTKGQVQLIDIRFKEEFEAWRVGPANNIPLPELPERLPELDADKIIVTACPHKDRTIIAMTYLRSKGIEAKYLTDGLIGLAENLRGDAARTFVRQLP